MDVVSLCTILASVVEDVGRADVAGRAPTDNASHAMTCARLLDTDYKKESPQSHPTCERPRNLSTFSGAQKTFASQG